MILEDVAHFYEQNDVKKNLLKIGSNDVLLSALMCSKYAIDSPSFVRWLTENTTNEGEIEDKISVMTDNVNWFV